MKEKEPELLSSNWEISPVLTLKLRRGTHVRKYVLTRHHEGHEDIEWVCEERKQVRPAFDGWPGTACQGHTNGAQT